MRVLEADEFLNTDDLDIVPVSLPDKYGADSGFYVRTLDGDARSAIEKQFANGRPSDDPRNFRASMLIRCVCKQDGTPVFTEAHRDRLMRKSAGTLETLFSTACRVNGFTKADVEEMEKN
mgnify:CR=1 FL=1